MVVTNNSRVFGYRVRRNGSRYEVYYKGGKYTGTYEISHFDDNARARFKAWETYGDLMLETPVFPSFIQAVAYLKSHANNLI